MQQKSKQTLSDKAGLPPGTLVHIGKKKTAKVRLSVIRYSVDEFQYLEGCTLDELEKECAGAGHKWINVDGVHDIDTISQLGKMFGLSSMLLEDVVNTYQRPKLEELDSMLYLNLRMIGLGKKRTLVSEQVGLVLTEDCLITFQERQGDLFDKIRERLNDNRTHLRNKGLDYLFYRLTDTIVDNYFFITEFFSARSDELESTVISSLDREMLAEIQKTKKMIVRVKRMVSPLRDPITQLYREEFTLVKKGTRPFFKDVYEHVMQIQESLELQRELIGGVMELYHSGVSQRTNEVMRVLTIISTIFIPLTFIAGIYGMNFKVMPELEWPYGYAMIWALMILVTALMVWLFKRKQWL